MRFGRGPSALAALLNVAAFDYFFVAAAAVVRPVSDVQYVLTFAIMLGVGLLVGQLTAGLRFAAGVSTSRERRARSLFELTRETLGRARSTPGGRPLGAAAVQNPSAGHALVLVTDAADQRGGAPADPPPGFDAQSGRLGLPPTARARALATATLAAQPWHYVPLRGAACACAACSRSSRRSRAGC